MVGKHGMQISSFVRIRSFIPHQIYDLYNFLWFRLRLLEKMEHMLKLLLHITSSV